MNTTYKDEEKMYRQNIDGNDFNNSFGVIDCVTVE